MTNGLRPTLSSLLNKYVEKFTFFVYFTVLIQLFYPTYILQINYSTLFVFVSHQK
jgi:hypothetical protein